MLRSVPPSRFTVWLSSWNVVGNVCSTWVKTPDKALMLTNAPAPWLACRTTM